MHELSDLKIWLPKCWFPPFQFQFTVAKGRESVGNLGLQTPGVSHLQDQGRLGFQGWLRVLLFDSVTKNTWEIMSKLVGACQDVLCLAGLYQLGGTTYSLGSHGHRVWLFWTVWNETKPNISQLLLPEETWRGSSQDYWVLMLIFTAVSSAEDKARWAAWASLTHSFLQPKTTLLFSPAFSEVQVPSPLLLPGPDLSPPWDIFRLLKWPKSIHFTLWYFLSKRNSWISSPQSQMNMRPRKDEAAGMQTWRGDHTNPLSSCKLLDWVSIFVRFTALGPSILLLPT